MPRKTFVAGEVLAAADVNEFLADQAVMTFAGTAARGSAIASPVEGMVTYLEDSDQVEVYGGTAVGWSSASNFIFGTAVPTDGQVASYSTAVSGWVPADASGGTILQIVRATYGTNISTSSTSLIDFGLSVTITPTSASNNIMLIFSGYAYPYSSTVSDSRVFTAITDSSNNYIDGADAPAFGMTTGGGETDFTNWGQQTIIGYDSPASTSAQTYKVRYCASNASASARYRNADVPAQLFAIEVAA